MKEAIGAPKRGVISRGKGKEEQRHTSTRHILFYMFNGLETHSCFLFSNFED